MGKDSGIVWCDNTFNHVRGCSEVSPGCAFCYAKTLAKRNPATLGVWGDEGTRVLASDLMWKQPIKWQEEYLLQLQDWELTRFDDEDDPRPASPLVFNASLADWAEDWRGSIVDSKGHVVHCCSQCGGLSADRSYCPACTQVGASRHATMSDVRHRLFKLIQKTSELTWLMLTKRPENISKFWPRAGFPDAGVPGTLGRRLYLENVWLGTTCENQKFAELRIPQLLKAATLSKALFLSVEPMLGPVSLYEAFYKTGNRWSSAGLTDAENGKGIDWVIVGCESGAQRRPMDLSWARKLMDECQRERVAFFVKQLEIDGAVTDDIAEFPADLQIREFPACRK